jgi:hypothetical protein
MGQWILDVWDVQEQAWRERVLPALKDGHFVKVSLAKIFKASKSPVFELIRTEVFSHKKILFEAVLAGVVINVVALRPRSTPCSFMTEWYQPARSVRFGCCPLALASLSFTS